MQGSVSNAVYECPEKPRRKSVQVKIEYDSEQEKYSLLNDSAQLVKRLPYYPDCATGFKGMSTPHTMRLSRKQALSYAYVQMNPKAYYSFLVLDIDRGISGADFWQGLGLAAPYFVVFNRSNNRGHVIYVLRSPVCKTKMGHYSALKYLRSIESAYTEIAGADKSYAGHMAKNPWSEEWRVIQVSGNVYDLSGLVTESVREQMQKPRTKARENVAGLGRNCFIFEHVRTWAYKAVREYWGGNFVDWYKAVKGECEKLNAKFNPCLSACELDCLAKSISLWVWKHITPAGFSIIQRGKINCRWSKESRKAEGIILLKAGFTVDETSEMLNVTQRTAYNWRSGMPEFMHETVSEVKPWLDMGISRRWYYELKKRGE